MTVENLNKLIEHACGVKHIIYNDIKNKFADFPICLMEYIEKDVHEKVVEIRFGDYKATLSTTFDEKDMCDFAILFPDRIENIDQVLLFLSEKYDYDFLKGSWMLPNCYMSVRESREGIVFSFRY